MNDLREKLIASGILDQSQLDQMRQWNMVPQNLVDKAGQGSVDELVDYLKQEGFDQPMPIIRETMLDADKIYRRGCRWLFCEEAEAAGLPLWAGRDIMGRFLVRIPYEASQDLALRIRHLIRPGTYIRHTEGDVAYQIEDTSLLYEEKLPAYWLCAVKKLNLEEPER